MDPTQYQKERYYRDEPGRIDLPFSSIHDIRKVYDVDPAQQYWIVDFRVNPLCLPISIHFDRLTENSRRKVLGAYLKDQLAEVHMAKLTCEVLDTYFDAYWDLIPEIRL